MQTTSEAYKTKIKEPSREFKCKITIGTSIYTNDDIVDIIIDSPQPSEGFSIGNTPSQTLDLTLLNKEDTIYSANQVKIEIGINTGSTIEYLVLGYFNIDDIEKTDYTTKITAFDNMIKFEAPFFSNLTYPATLQAVVNELAAKTGVQFTGSLPSYTLSKLEGFTCREILGYVASLCGGNAVITRDGKFTIVVPQDINYSIGTDNYFDYKREEVKYKISKVSCKAGDTELIKGALGADSMELTFENPWVTDSILTDIYTKLNGFEYLGYTMKWQGDLSLDIGDIVTCTDIKGVIRKLPILSQKLTYNGGLTSEIGAKGETKNKNSYNSKGENTKKLERFVTELAIVNKALIDVAYIGDLTAGNIKFDTASGGVLDLQSLLANFISGDNGQFIHLTGSNVVIDNAVIKDAMIDTISAGKISAGTMSTNKFTISSDSGNLVIADNTIQIRDGTRVRVQIGKDASNDYSLYVWDNTGKLMFDALGLKADAIKDKIIRNDMVADTANISGSKLDIDSVIVEVNTNGTETFKSSKVKMDSTGQTLDVAFTKVSQDAAGAIETANTAQTDVGIANGKIETLVKNTTIVKEDGTTVQLKDAYISTEQTVEGMTTTVSNLETTVNGENGLTSKMQIVEQKITDESIVNTIKSSQTDGKDTFAQTSIVEQMVDQVKFKFNSVAITNLLVNSNFPNRLATGWSMQGVDYYTANPSAFTPYDGWVALQLTSDRGLFYQPIMAGDKLPKRNSKYTFSLSSKTEANIEIFRLYIDYKLGTSYVGNQIVDLKLGNNIDRYSVSFITKDVDYDQVLFYIEVKPKADTTGYRVFSIGLPCLSLGDSASYTSRQNEIMSGNTIIDANGVTVTNGALTVKNNAGNTVINGDSNGNLVLGGSSTSGSLLIKNSSGIVIGTLDKNGITLKDTGIKIINSSEGLVNGNYIGTKNVEFDASNIHFSGTVDVGQGGGSDSNAYIEFTPLDRSYLYGRLDYKANYNNFVGNLSVEGNTNVKELYADGWLRTTGNRGWYSQTYSGGIYMTDSTWIRTYNGKNFYCDKILQGQTVDAVTLATVNRIGGRSGANNFYLGASSDIAGRVEANTSGVRIYTTWMGNADSGILIANDGTTSIKSSNTVRHQFAANGTKTGGTMDIEGTTYGMSPTDSPQTLIEYIEFDVAVDEETEVFLDAIYSKMISKFTAILSNSEIKIKEKRLNSIVLVGTGTTDIVFKGQRKEADQYFRIMNGFITQGYEKEGII